MSTQAFHHIHSEIHSPLSPSSPPPLCPLYRLPFLLLPPHLPLLIAPLLLPLPPPSLTLPISPPHSWPLPELLPLLISPSLSLPLRCQPPHLPLPLLPTPTPPSCPPSPRLLHSPAIAPKRKKNYLHLNKDMLQLLLSFCSFTHLR